MLSTRARKEKISDRLSAGVSSERAACADGFGTPASSNCSAIVPVVVAVALVASEGTT